MKVRFLLIVILVNLIFCQPSDSTLIKGDNDSTQIITWRAIAASIVATTACIVAYDEFNTTWGDSKGAFQWKSSDLYGDNYAGLDEVSHFIVCQKITELSKSIAKWVGFNNKSSDIISVSIGFLIGLWVELLDAYNVWQGFGVSDMVADMAGIAFQYLKSNYPFWDKFDMKIAFKGTKDISPLLVVARRIPEYDNIIYNLTYKPSEKYPVEFSLGYSTSRDKSGEDAGIVRSEVYLGVGFTLKDIIYLFDKNLANKYGGFVDWYHFSLNARIYKSNPIRWH